jgi:hypothetical protein
VQQFQGLVRAEQAVLGQLRPLLVGLGQQCGVGEVIRADSAGDAELLLDVEVVLLVGVGRERQQREVARREQHRRGAGQDRERGPAVAPARAPVDDVGEELRLRTCDVGSKAGRDPVQCLLIEDDLAAVEVGRAECCPAFLAQRFSSISRCGLVRSCVT